MENKENEQEELFFLDIITDEFENYFINRKIQNLYHYTNVYGLKGILEENTLWATHYSYLNDPNEIKYGLKIIKEVLNNELDENNTVKTALDMFLILLEDEFTEFNVLDNEIYITSFCENNNLLGQWREYAENGKGYCICINNTDELVIGPYWEDIKAESSFYPCLLPKPVLYDYEEQRDFIKTIFNNTVIKLDNDFSKMNTKSDKNIKFRIIIEYLRDLIIYILPLLKKKEFEEEKEWRILSFPKNMNNEIHHREKNNLLIPYQKLSFYTKNDKEASKMNVPINKIIYGNSLNSEKAENSLKSFLRYKNIKNIEILKSNIEIGE